MYHQDRVPRRTVKNAPRRSLPVNKQPRPESWWAIERLEQRQLLSASPVLVSANASGSDTVIATAGKPISAVVGHSTGRVVLATFTDPGGAGPVSDYSATVVWGDGTPADNSAVIVEKAPNSYSVIDSHTYALDVSPAHTAGKP